MGVVVSEVSEIFPLQMTELVKDRHCFMFNGLSYMSSVSVSTFLVWIPFLLVFFAFSRKFG